MKIMCLSKFFFNAIVGSSLIIFLCCSGSKQITVANDTKIEKEVNYIPYYLKVYEAKGLFEQGNYERSFEILDSLFRKYEPLNQFMVYEYKTYLQSAYLRSNKHILPKAFIRGIEEYGLSDLVFENDSIMNLVYKESGLDCVKYMAHWSRYLDKINFGLRDTIKEMVKRDRFKNREDWDTPEAARRLDSIDSIN